MVQKKHFQTLSEVAKAFGADEIVSSMETPTVTLFKQSPKIATYLFVIIAGPYKNIAINEEAHPPMKVYMRDSLM